MSDPIRVCSICQRGLPATTVYFSPRLRSRFGLNARCRECLARQTRERRRRLAARPVGDASAFIRCTTCAVEKPATTEFFHRVANGRYGLRSMCKTCFRQYQIAHPELKTRSKAWNDAHRPLLRELSRQWAIDNAEHARELARRWVRANPGKIGQYWRTRRATERQARTIASAPLSMSDWQAILDDFDHRCAYCCQPASPLHKEHMTPISRGGADDRENVVPACPRCNARKHTRTLLEWVAA